MYSQNIKSETNQFSCSRCEETSEPNEEILKTKIILNNNEKEYILERFPNHLCTACIIQLRKSFIISQLIV